MSAERVVAFKRAGEAQVAKTVKHEERQKDAGLLKRLSMLQKKAACLGTHTALASSHLK
jgi:hypothetical protein